MAVVARLHNRASSFRQRFNVAYLAIHPSSTTSPFPGLRGGWSISQPPPGERCSTSRTSRQHITGIKYKDRQLFTFTPRVNSESPILLSHPQCISVSREGGGGASMHSQRGSRSWCPGGPLSLHPHKPQQPGGLKVHPNPTGCPSR